LNSLDKIAFNGDVDKSVIIVRLKGE
jgi:hypothetical protein